MGDTRLIVVRALLRLCALLRLRAFVAITRFLEILVFIYAYFTRYSMLRFLLKLQIFGRHSEANIGH